MDKDSLGRLGEQLAEKYLKKKGYKIIARNYRTTRWGEIDRIAVHKDTLVFVEVRTRTSDDFLTPQESITGRKLRSISRTAKYYFLTHENDNLPQALRIDLVGVTLTSNGKGKPAIEHFENISS